MYPHERSLVARLNDKPFVILGINSDPKENLKKAIEREKMTWRSWWDGGNPNGPIASKWNVSGWPTVYVLDHKGVIRYKEAELDEAVDTLLKELDQEAKVDQGKK